MMEVIFLGQDDGAASGGWFGLSDVFWLTILVVFVLGIAAAFVRLLQKDKCLKLLDDYHVTYLAGGRRTIWGDLRVAGGGLELVYDAPYRTRRGLDKSTSLIFADELNACVAVCRTVHGLTEKERRNRQRQIRRSFRPGLLRRLARWLRNVINTMRDAFVKSLSLLTGQVAKARPVGGAVGSQKGQVDELGATLVGTVGNAYEQLLERHIGRPVVVELAHPAGGDHPPVELPGYLVDYSDRFVAVFNVEQEPQDAFELRVTEPVQREGVKVDRAGDKLELTCDGEDALILRRMTFGGAVTDLAVTLVPGTSIQLTVPAGEPAVLHRERTRHIDIVCPRTTARVRHGSDAAGSRREWSGVAPEVDEA
ncbi:MAG: hypothetical protein ACYSUR_09180 [Planctomycetota bacterium]|jgi:hypothetical protein